jgi:hypothetical protein
MSDDGYWAETMDGERVWCAYPERERCGGSGWMNCYCGGDLCVCGNQGGIECMGCVDCEGEDDYGDDFHDDMDEP